MFILSSARTLNLDRSKILSFGMGIRSSFEKESSYQTDNDVVFQNLHLGLKISFLLLMKLVKKGFSIVFTDALLSM